MEEICYYLIMKSIQEIIKTEMIEALKAKNQVKLNTLRGILSAFVNDLVSRGIPPTNSIDDETAIIVIKKATKQRKDSIGQFTSGGRTDLAEVEKEELDILMKFIPSEMSDEEIAVIVAQKKETLQISDKSKIGILIGAVMKECGGRADGGRVKLIIEKNFI